MLQRLFALLLAFGAPAGAQAQSAGLEEARIEAFFKDVQVGKVAETLAALRETPALAQARDRYEFQAIQLMDTYFEREIFDALLAAGADVNAVNDQGIALAHILSEPDALPHLVRAGADLNLKDGRGRTPLIASVEDQRIVMLEALLAYDVDLDARSADGHTALSLAQQYGMVAFIEALENAR